MLFIIPSTLMLPYNAVREASHKAYYRAHSHTVILHWFDYECSREMDDFYLWPDVFVSTVQLTARAQLRSSPVWITGLLRGSVSLGTGCVMETLTVQTPSMSTRTAPAGPAPPMSSLATTASASAAHTGQRAIQSWQMNNKSINTQMRWRIW